MFYLISGQTLGPEDHHSFEVSSLTIIDLTTYDNWEDVNT